MPPRTRINWSNQQVSFDGGKTWTAIKDLKITEIEEENTMGNNFKVGDYVQAIRNGANYEKGSVCEVYRLHPDSHYLYLKDLCSGKDYGGCCAENFVLYHTDDEIRIYRDPDDPRKTVAERIRTGEKGVSRCAPEDAYDLYTGAKLALERLEKKQNRPYSWNGKMVCVDKGESRVFTTGKVYAVKNGRLYDDMGAPYCSHVFAGPDAIIHYMTVYNSLWRIKMIEFKGE